MITTFSCQSQLLIINLTLVAGIVYPPSTTSRVLILQAPILVAKSRLESVPRLLFEAFFGPCPKP